MAQLRKDDTLLCSATSTDSARSGAAQRRARLSTEQAGGPPHALLKTASEIRQVKASALGHAMTRTFSCPYRPAPPRPEPTSVLGEPVEQAARGLRVKEAHRQAHHTRQQPLLHGMAQDRRRGLLDGERDAKSLSRTRSTEQCSLRLLMMDGRTCRAKPRQRGPPACLQHARCVHAAHDEHHRLHNLQAAWGEGPTAVTASTFAPDDGTQCQPGGNAQPRAACGLPGRPGRRGQRQSRAACKTWCAAPPGRPPPRPTPSPRTKWKASSFAGPARRDRQDGKPRISVAGQLRCRRATGILPTGKRRYRGGVC